MLLNELERVFANREFVKEVIKEKRREGRVETPDMVVFGESFGRERMKICVNLNQPLLMKLTRRRDPTLKT